MTANKNFLKQIREARNLTQEQLSTLSGVRRESISDYENGKVRPNPRSIAKLCEVLECSYSHLLTGQERSASTSETLNNRETKSTYVKEAFLLVNDFVGNNFKEIAPDILMQTSIHLAQTIQEYDEATAEEKQRIIIENKKNMSRAISNILFLQQNKS